MKVTEETLKGFGPKGKFLVVRLNRPHRQKGCKDVPAGTIGVIKGGTIGRWVFVFPHSILGEKIKAFSDGDVRIIRDMTAVDKMGRIG